MTGAQNILLHPYRGMNPKCFRNHAQPESSSRAWYLDKQRNGINGIAMGVGGWLVK